MRPHLHHRRHAPGSFRRLPSSDVCVQAGRVHTGFGPESEVYRIVGDDEDRAFAPVSGGGVSGYDRREC
jgi:hypothetical protein